MSPGVDDRSVPLPLNEQQAASSMAGLKDSVAEKEDVVRKLETEEEELRTVKKELYTKEEKLQTKEEMLSDHVDLLIRCVRHKTFTRDALGTAAKYFVVVPPSEADVLARIRKLETEKEV